MSRADGLAAEAAMAEDHEHATSVSKGKVDYLPSFVRRAPALASAHQFLLAELPPNLREALADYDVDGDGARVVLRPGFDPRRQHCQKHRCARYCSTLIAAQPCARRHGDCARDCGRRSSPAPAEEKGEQAQLSRCSLLRAFYLNAS
jgi:hypothetical protein